MSQSIVTHARCIALIAACVVPVVAAHAAWEARPEVGLTLQSSDNVLVDVQNERSASRGALEAAILLSGFNERGDIYFEPRFSTDTYAESENSDLESDDYFLRAGGEHRGQTTSTGFRLSYSNESILRSEFADVVPDDPDAPISIDPDTGRLEFFNETRKLLYVDGNVNFELSQRNQLELGAGYTDASYSLASASNQRSDFDDSRISLALDHQINERSRFSTTVLASQFVSDSNSNTTDTTGIDGTFTRSLSSTWTMDLTAGVRKSDYTFLEMGTVVDNSDTNYALRLGLRKRAEVGLWNIDVAHDVFPNGNKFVVVRDQAVVYVQRQLRPRLRGEFGFGFYQTRTLGDVNNIDDRDYARADLTFEWSLQETVVLSFGYSFTSQEFVNENIGSANENVFAVGMTYRSRGRPR